MIARLLSLDLYLNANNDSAPPQAPAFSLGVFSGVPAPVEIPVDLLSTLHTDVPQSTAAAAAPAAPSPSLALGLADMPAAVVLSRWTTVDEEEEKQQIPQLPISKWLQQEHEAAAAAATEAAARAAEQLLQESIFSDDEEDNGPTTLVAGGPLFGNSNSNDLDRGQRNGQ
jgi:U2-associated protein SR140